MAKALDIKIPSFDWKQISGDMDPGKYGGTIAEADGEHIETIVIQPTRELVGDGEAKEVGFPFWSKEGWFDIDDLDPNGPNAKEVKSALKSIGMSVIDGELVDDGSGNIVGETPEARALVIVEALIGYGRGDEGPAGWAKDVIGNRQVDWWGSRGKREGWEYIADEDEEFRREILGEEDEDSEEELEENRRRNGSIREEKPIDRGGASIDRWALVDDGDFMIEYWPGFATYVYQAVGGKLVRRHYSGDIGRAIGKKAFDDGQHAGVVFEIKPSDRSGLDYGQIGNIEVTRHGGKVIWMASKRTSNARQKKFPFARGPADKRLRDAYAFFKTFGGGGRVGHAAEDSMSLARAERIAEERGWKASWREEEEDWNDFLGDFTKRDEVESVQYCVLEDADGEVLGSLGGIVWLWKSSTQENRNYARFVEAQIALEAAEEQDLL